MGGAGGAGGMLVYQVIWRMMQILQRGRSGRGGGGAGGMLIPGHGFAEYDESDEWFDGRWWYGRYGWRKVVKDRAVIYI